MNKTLILVVEDDAPVRNLITTTLKTNNYKYLVSTNGESAITEASCHNPDIILLDLGLPDLDGVEVIKRIRTWSNTPIIVISARSEDSDKIEALDSGADDYLTKPFSPKELMARIHAVLKRCSNIQTNIYEYETLELNHSAHTLKIDNKLVNITPKEYQIISYLINNKNIAISREQLLNQIWGYDFFGDVRTVDTHIKMLRNNLGRYRDLIVTVHGLGYKFVDEKE